ncbi:MAG: tetratricopeptide repeat protein [Limisphaerales bacterium]
MQNLLEEGRRLLADGKIADALYVATKATERDGANSDAWALLGEARFRFGDVDDAIYEYKRAIKLKPNDPFYYHDLGDVYSSTDKFDDALTQYKRAAQIAPTTAMFRAAIGRVLLRQSKSSEAIPILEQCVKEEPANDYFQWELAIAYVDSSQDSWTYVPEGSEIPAGFYATSKAQVMEALALVEKAERLKFNDQELRTHIAKVKEDVKRNLKRRYHGSTVAAVVGGMIWSCAYGLGLLFGPFYFYASRPPQYALNKHIIGGGSTGADKAFAAAGKVANVVGANENVRGGIGLAVMVGTGMFLPVMAIWNYVKNYTGENNLKDLQLAPIPISTNSSRTNH